MPNKIKIHFHYPDNETMNDQKKLHEWYESHPEFLIGNNLGAIAALLNNLVQLKAGELHQNEMKNVINPIIGRPQ